MGAWTGWEAVGVYFAITAAYQLCFFVFAATFQTDKLTDFAGSTNFAVIVVLSLLLGADAECGRFTIVTALVCLWTIRLASFLFMRILRWGHDNRFDKMRANPVQFGAFWVLQALWAWGTTVPVVILNEGPNTLAPSDGCSEFWALDYVAWALAGIGLVIETFADLQKLWFKSDEANRGKWCDAGLWRFSRHPNYAGEMLFWWALYLACCAGYGNSDSSPYLVGLVGPLTVTGLLLLLSGMPILEASADKKYGGQAEYRAYKESTSPLVLLPQSVYRACPMWVKKFLLFEWDMYNRKRTPSATEGVAAPDAYGTMPAQA